MLDIKLWFSPGACSLAPHILLHELRVPFQAVSTPVSDGAQLTKEFARINPKKRVPVLALGGQTITEVPAIAMAISNLAPERRLMGRTPLDCAKVHEWMSWLSGTLHGQGFGALWRPERYSAEHASLESIRAKARITIADCFDLIESSISGQFAVGSHFTAVDPYLLVFFRWGNEIGFDMPTFFPRYASLARSLVKRNSVASTLIAEGIADQPFCGRGAPKPLSASNIPSTEGTMS